MKRLSNYKHIIWDWNGTLINDAQLTWEATNHVLNHLKYPEVTFEMYQAAHGFPFIDAYKRLGLNLDEASFHDTQKVFHSKYQALVQSANLHDSALDTLSYFKSEGLKQSILSAHMHEKVLEDTARYNLQHFFHIIKGLEDNKARGKIANGIELLAQLNSEASSILLIGDTTHDFDVATAIGSDCALVAAGSETKTKLENTGARVFTSLTELLEFAQR